jgi:hypothetical protein
MAEAALNKREGGLCTTEEKGKWIAIRNDRHRIAVLCRAGKERAGKEEEG